MDGSIKRGTKGAWALRLFLGGIFLYAGVLKLLDPEAFLENVLAFGLLQRPAAWATALALPWLEALAGLAVLLGRPWKRGSILVLALLSAAFLGLQAYAWAQGLDVNCGCFKPGAENATNHPLMVGLDAALLAAALALLARTRLPAPARHVYEM